MYRNTCVVVDLDRLKNNVQNIIQNYKGYTYYFGVVKGNVYGHGAYASKALVEAGVNYLAVSSLEEATCIRKYEKNIPILCLEPIALKYVGTAYDNAITLTVSSLAYAKELITCFHEKKLKIHMKINTGMNRLGFKNKEEVKEAYHILKENYILEGIYTHFITTGISDPFWDKQVATFESLTSEIALDEIPIIHMGRSITLINHPKIPMCNGIRLGILMYGFNQSPKPNLGLKGKLKNLKASMRIRKYHISPTVLECKAKVKQAFSLYAEVMELQSIEKGEHVGYGLSYTAAEKEKIAIVPIGYADGFNRKNAGRFVAIRGKKYPLVGSVNMGMIQIKVDDTIQVGDRVELLGDTISVRYAATYLNTTPHECMCMLSSSLPRVYMENGKVCYIDGKKE